MFWFLFIGIVGWDDVPYLEKKTLKIYLFVPWFEVT